MAIEVKLFDDCDAVARDAAGALDRARQPSLFDRLDWFRLTHAHVRPEDTLLVARAREGEDSAWLFLADCGRRRAEAFASWYTLAFRPVLAGTDENRLLTALARRLRARFATITLSPMPDPRSIARAFAKAGWLARRTVMTSNWVADTGGADFSAYWDRRPSRLRNTARRKTRDGGFDIRISDAFDPALWSAYEQVYAQSWKPAEGSPAFLRELAIMEGSAGTLRLGVAFREGAPLAAQFWTVENGRAIIHKLAYVESARDLSPGTVLTEAMFRHVIDRDSPALIDFGTGDDAYKADWMDRRETLWRLELHNPLSARGVAGAARWGASTLVRAIRSV